MPRNRKLEDPDNTDAIPEKGRGPLADGEGILHDGDTLQAWRWAPVWDGAIQEAPWEVLPRDKIGDLPGEFQLKEKLFVLPVKSLGLNSW